MKQTNSDHKKYQNDMTQECELFFFFHLIFFQRGNRKKDHSAEWWPHRCAWLKANHTLLVSWHCAFYFGKNSGSPLCSRVLTLRETPILSQSTPSGMGRPSFSSSSTSGDSASVWPCPPWIPVTTAPQSAATGSRKGNRRGEDPRRVTRRTSLTALPIATFNLER